MLNAREESLQEVFDLWLVYQQWDELKTLYGLETLDSIPDLIKVINEVNQELRRLRLTC